MPNNSKYSPLWEEAGNKVRDNYWEAFSPKLGRRVRLYSDLHHDHWVTIEANPNIKTFCEYPAKITIKVENLEVSELLDMWIRWRNGQEEFRIVRYSPEPKKDRNNSSERSDHLERWCRNQGASFTTVLFDEVQKSQFFISNWIRAMKFLGKDSICDELTHSLQNQVEKEKGVTIANLLASHRLHSEEEILRRVFTLLHSGKVSSDLEQRQLSKATILRSLP